MSAAAQQAVSTVLEADGAPTEPQDQQPSDASQKDLSSASDSKTVSKSESSSDTLRPADEVQDQEASKVEGDVQTGTPPASAYPVPSSDASELQGTREDINTERKLQKSSADDSEPSPGRIFQSQAEKLTFDLYKCISRVNDLCYSMADWELEEIRMRARRNDSDASKPTPRLDMEDPLSLMPSEGVLLKSGENETPIPSSLRRGDIGKDLHQSIEDGRRTNGIPPPSSGYQQQISTKGHQSAEDLRRANDNSPSSFHRELRVSEKVRQAAEDDRRLRVSEKAHQAAEDGRRTPPRARARITRPAKLITSAYASDKSKRRRALPHDLFDAGKSSLFYTLTAKNDRNRPKTAVLNVVALQRMNLHALQEVLAECAATSFTDGQLGRYPATTQANLNRYCDAVRNLDFMTEKARLGYDKDPFLLKSSRALERRILESSGLIPAHVLPKGDLPLPEDYEHPLLSNESGGRHHANEMTSKKQRLERSAMASFGGLLIIVPMLIMANVPGKVASLVTSCVAITIFAALVTLVTRLGPHEVLASVAAYAAVLVVFVGLSLEKR